MSLVVMWPAVIGFVIGSGFSVLLGYAPYSLVFNFAGGLMGFLAQLVYWYSPYPDVVGYNSGSNDQQWGWS